MILNNQQAHFLLIILVFTLFNFDAYGMSLPETRFTLVGDLKSGCAASAAGGLTPEQVATLSDAGHREYIVNHDKRLESERKEIMDAKQLLEACQDETYKLALESHTHAKTLNAKAAQKEIDLKIDQKDLTRNWADVGSKRAKAELIKETAKTDEAVDQAYNALKQARAAFAEARLKIEAAAKNLQKLGQDPPPLTKEVSQLDDEEYIIEASKHDLGVLYSLKLWRKSREWLHEAVERAYTRYLPFVWAMRHLPPTYVEELVSEHAEFLELLARGMDSSIDRMTALTSARIGFMTPLMNRAGRIRIPGLRRAVRLALRYQQVEKICNNAALIRADRYWISTGKISSEGKRYKGLTFYTPYDSIMTVLETFKPMVGNWYKRLLGLRNPNHTPGDLKSLAIVPYKGFKID